MATLIPALGSCVSRMSRGEKRLAERLEQKLDDDYLLWYDVPVGPKRSHPDFVVLHPRRGLLILEVKDWHLDTIRQASKGPWEILAEGIPKTVSNPAEQARQHAHHVVDALKRDAQLIHAEGKWQGMLTFPWSYGVVLTNITRKQFEAAELHRAIEEHRVVCSDEMTESVDPEALQSRFWGMFPVLMRGALSLPQIDRVRWTLFPEIRVQNQGLLFDDNDAEARIPELLQVMDLQQEQLARSLGDGHRVIHGVAGSGKTMILGYRAEYLAKSVTSKPILVLCYNEPLAVKLASVMEAKGLSDRVHARHFHKWCRDQLVTYGLLPTEKMSTSQLMEEFVDRVIRGVDKKQIPSGQYQAILIDEGHDFQPEWLKLVTQMVDPETNSLLLLYDDAQSIYERQRTKQFSFKSVGIQAQGRTTVLKINYRNTRQILQTASLIAADLLTAEDKDDDGIPLLRPVSCGREGHAPLVVRLPSLRDEAVKVAELLSTAHQEGHAWGDMAVICRQYAGMEECANALRLRKLPHQVRKGSGDFKPNADTIKIMTMHVSKGLEFPVVAVVGSGAMPRETDDEREEARLFYVAATRATQKLFITVSGDAAFGKRL
ncbi:MULTISPECIES: DEAD/DEAH box helicase [Variovorax]|uniref:DEAD/DEAH box helicase n=1 Tax=Variovorax TaxID=34072 RepID=UPI001F1E5096|nr:MULTISPECIES: 3'-5' exonuclease [Variovorax]UKI08847.1 NERD domain-containing protein [Variovorax paradoxus]